MDLMRTSAISLSQEVVRPDLVKRPCSLRVFILEAFASLYYVLPLSMDWFRKRYISQEIEALPLQVTTGKTTAFATLYLHGCGQIKEDEEVEPVLFVHGDYGHPFSLLHLAEAAEKETKGPVFSLYIPNIHDNDLLSSHSALLKEAIGKIEEFVQQRGGIFRGVRGVGHSKGAIMLAERQFVHPDPGITGVFAVGGRLRVPEGDTSCKERLKPFVQRIYRAIQKKTNPLLYQVIPEEDWNGPREAMAVRPQRDCYIVPGLHLSALYTKRVAELMEEFLQSKVFISRLSKTS